MEPSSPPDRGLTTRPSWGVPPTPASTGRVNGTRGRTNGLVNGMGRTNGLVNGVGRTNGLGTGLGYVNGVRLRRSTHGVVASSDVRRTVAFIAGAIGVMFVLSYFLGAQEPSGSPFAVDGDFSEWASVTKYADEVDNVSPDADLVAFGVQAEVGRVYVYGQTRGPLFPNPEPTSVYLLIDDPYASGYPVAGFDADFLAEMWGWDGVLRETTIREWPGAADVDNATAFLNRGSLVAASSGTELELVVRDTTLDLDPARGLRFALATRSLDSTDRSPSAGQLPGALLVDQTPLLGVMSGSSDVLEVRLRPIAADVEIQRISVDHTGGGTLIPPALPLTLTAGQVRLVRFNLNPLGLSPGSLVTVHVTGVDAIAVARNAPVPATVTGPAARVYVQSMPAGHAVDGIFADWTGIVSDPDDMGPASVDLRGSAVDLDGDAFFYVRTEADVLAGGFLPEARLRPPPFAGNGSASGTFPIPRRTTEDVLRIYLDTDDRDGLGFPIGGIVADRLVEVKGRAGRVTARAVHIWNESDLAWNRLPGVPQIAFEGTEFEARVLLADLGTTYNPRVVFESTDWSGFRDLSDAPSPLLAPAMGRGPQPLHDPTSQLVTAPPLLNIPVVNGLCGNPAGEYTGRAIGSGSGLSFAIGRRDDLQQVFICVSTADTTNDPFSDWSVLVFDTAHDAGPAPIPDDRLFFLYNGDFFLYGFEGDGVWWIACTVCDPTNQGVASFNGVRVIYEYAIRYTDIWGTLTPSSNQVAGFGVAAVDGPLGSYFWWGSSLMDYGVPDTWGHLAIPEFPLPAVAAAAGLLLPLVRRMRRRPDASLDERRV